MAPGSVAWAVTESASLDGQPVQVCSLCRLAYTDASLAEACEAHCAQSDSCDLAIGRQAVGSVDDGAPP